MNKINKQVQKENKTINILQECSLTVQQGDMIAITGQSGIGKSTLLNIIGCLDQPSSGTYHLNGQDITSLSTEHKSKIRKEIFGYIFQQYWLIKHLTILENVELALHYKGMKNTRKIATETLETLGLLQHQHQLPNQLSGGQQQKSSIARAIATQPKIIIADEPTGALDKKSSHQVMSLLKDINHTTQTTIIVVTHDQDMAKICNKQMAIESLFHTNEIQNATL